MTARIIHGDCRVVARSLDPVDSIVTDPPYGLEFMGKAWDRDVPGVPYWARFLRVAKPGAHMLVFGGTRTFHRLGVNVEDAGWEIRDCLIWLYNQGMPKGLDLGNGLNTTLKPGWEPILLVRKPLEMSVRETVAAHGTGALNIGACRIPMAEDDSVFAKNPHTVRNQRLGDQNVYGDIKSTSLYDPTKGRWPTNVLHDGDVGLGENGRFFWCPKARGKERGEGNNHPTVKPIDLMRYLVRLVTPPGGVVLDPFAGSGSTLVAAEREGFDSIGIELEERYCTIAKRRIEDGGRDDRAIAGDPPADLGSALGVCG